MELIYQIIECVRTHKKSRYNFVIHCEWNAIGQHTCVKVCEDESKKHPLHEENIEMRTKLLSPSSNTHTRTHTLSQHTYTHTLWARRKWRTHIDRRNLLVTNLIKYFIQHYTYTRGRISEETIQSIPNIHQVFPKSLPILTKVVT